MQNTETTQVICKEEKTENHDCRKEQRQQDELTPAQLRTLCNSYMAGDSKYLGLFLLHTGASIGTALNVSHCHLFGPFKSMPDVMVHLAREKRNVVLPNPFGASLAKYLSQTVGCSGNSKIFYRRQDDGKTKRKIFERALATALKNAGYPGKMITPIAFKQAYEKTREGETCQE